MALELHMKFIRLKKFLCLLSLIFLVSVVVVLFFGFAIPILINQITNLLKELSEYITKNSDLINTKMTEILDVATDPWGIKVTRVELKNILPPKDIREAMEKQMRAERERREAILQAEGFKQSKILEAEGIKQSKILEAEAQKQAKILAAEAQKQAEILEAEGEAESILKVKEAEAAGIKLIREAGADNAVLTLKAYEALAEVSKGQATKIIIPSELQGIAGLVSSIKGVSEDK